MHTHFVAAQSDSDLNGDPDGQPLTRTAFAAQGDDLKGCPLGWHTARDCRSGRRVRKSASGWRKAAVVAASTLLFAPEYDGETYSG